MDELNDSISDELSQVDAHNTHQCYTVYKQVFSNVSTFAVAVSISK